MAEEAPLPGPGTILSGTSPGKVPTRVPTGPGLDWAGILGSGQTAAQHTRFPVPRNFYKNFKYHFNRLSTGIPRGMGRLLFLELPALLAHGGTEIDLFLKGSGWNIMKNTASLLGNPEKPLPNRSFGSKNGQISFYLSEKLININENNGALDLERSLLWKYCKEFIKTNNSMENWCIFEEVSFSNYSHGFPDFRDWMSLLRCVF